MSVRSTGQELFAALWSDYPDPPAWGSLNVFDQARWERLATRLNDQHQGAVSLLDELADALADVARYQIDADDTRVRDVLHRAALHANGGPTALTLPRNDQTTEADHD